MTFKGITFKKLGVFLSVAAMLYLAGCGGGGGAKSSNSFPSKPDTGSVTVSMATVSVARVADRSAEAATIRDYTGYAYRVSNGADAVTGTVTGTSFTATGVKPGRNILVEVYKDKVKLKAYVSEIAAGKTATKGCDVKTTAAAIVWEGLGGSSGKSISKNVEDLESDAADSTSDVYAVVTALNTALNTAVNNPTSITGSDMLTVSGVTTAATTATTAVSEDTTAPTIKLITPNNNTIEQSTTDTSIVLLFSEAMSSTVPTGISVDVKDVTLDSATTTVTSSAISWDASQKVLTINYGVALNYDSSYRVVVTLDPSLIKDAAGNSLTLASVNGSTVNTTAKSILVAFSTIYEITAWVEATKVIKDATDIGAFDTTLILNYVDDAGNDLGTIADSGAEFVGKAACSTCHSAIYTTFIKTNHATAMVRKAANVGKPGDHFSGNCIYCHSVDGPRLPDYSAGLDKPTRTNLANGAWGLTATDYSAYTADEIILYATNSAMAGIQCENCHGPASNHVDADHATGDTVEDIVGPDQAVSAAVCTVCHDAPTHHMNTQNWKKTAHSAALDGTHMGGSNSCAPCHSVEGFLALIDRQEEDATAVPWDGLTRNQITGVESSFKATDSPGRNAYGNVSCVACHDPHEAADGINHQLRKPVEELCASCHSGRLKIPGSGNWRGPHHNTQARVINGLGLVNPDGKMLWKGAGYICAALETGISIEATSLTECDTTKDYMETVATTLTKKTMGETECVDCHMYDGNHTMSPSEEACQHCHAGMNASAVVGAIQSKSNHMISKLNTRFAKMKTDAVLVSNLPSAWDTGTATNTAYFNIDWNLKWLQYDGGLGMHNVDMQELGYKYTDEMLTDFGY